MEMYSTVAGVGDRSKLPSQQMSKARLKAEGQRGGRPIDSTHQFRDPLDLGRVACSPAIFGLIICINLVLYAATVQLTVTSSIRSIELSPGSARMPVGKLQGRPAAARGRRSLASFVGCIFSALTGEVKMAILAPGDKDDCLEGFEALYLLHQPGRIRVKFQNLVAG